ncbi:hypothetical protein ACQ5SO_17480 [Rhodovulum sp. DZ06]|uniref:hypothetical protein n=1 Tax=Rhodovulum sp. DZ06 TaxID=3425126 RepID=UPI003D34EF04
MGDRIPGADGAAMTLEEFRLLSEIHGGTVEDWPADRRAAASALLDALEEARAALAEAAALDAALAGLVAAPPEAEGAVPDALMARILADADAALAPDAAPATPPAPVQEQAAAPPNAAPPNAVPPRVVPLRRRARREIPSPFALLHGFAAPAALAACALVGLFLGWSAPETLVDPVYGALSGASAEESFMSAALMTEFDPFAVDPAQ